MNRNDIVIGGVILAVLVGGFLLLRRDSTPALNPQPSPSVMASVEQQLEDAFKVDIPDDVEKTNLEAVGSVGGTGIVTRDFENNVYSVTILADLPEPASGKFYQAWIANGDDFHTLNRLTVGKGGYMLNYKSDHNHPNDNRVVVSEETTVGNAPTDIVLEGSF